MPKKHLVLLALPFLAADSTTAAPKAEIRHEDRGLAWEIPPGWFWGCDSNRLFETLYLDHWNKVEVSAGFALEIHQEDKDPLDLARSDSAFAYSLNASEQVLFARVSFLAQPAVHNAYGVKVSDYSMRCYNYFFQRNGTAYAMKIMAFPADWTTRKATYDSVLAGLRFLAPVRSRLPVPGPAAKASKLSQGYPSGFGVRSGKRIRDLQGRLLARPGSRVLLMSQDDRDPEGAALLP